MIQTKQIALTEHFIVSPESTSDFAAAKIIIFAEMHLDTTFRKQSQQLIQALATNQDFILYEGYPSLKLITIQKAPQGLIPCYGWDDINAHSASMELLRRFKKPKHFFDIYAAIITSIQNAHYLNKIKEYAFSRNQSLIHTLQTLNDMGPGRFFITLGRNHLEDAHLKKYLQEQPTYIIYSKYPPKPTQAEVQAYYYNDTDN